MDSFSEEQLTQLATLLDERLASMVARVMACAHNNVRCKCGWVGPHDMLRAAGSLARLHCPNCGEGYDWISATTNQFFLAAEAFVPSRKVADHPGLRIRIPRGVQDESEQNATLPRDGEWYG